MILRELNIEEFNDFVNKHSLNNFMQSALMYKRYMLENKEAYLLGVIKENEVVGASLIVNTAKFMDYKLFEALQGFILDYQDKEVLDFFVEEIKKFLKTKKGYRLVINPYLPLCKRNSVGEMTNEIDNSDLKKHLLSLGFEEINNYEQVKLIYCLDINGLSKEELFKTFKSNARNCINKTINKFSLDIKEVSYEELPEYKAITLDTAKRRNFADRSLKYYQNMYQIFGDKVRFLICYLDLDKYIDNLKKEKQELLDKLEKLSDAKANDKKKENLKLEIGYDDNYLIEALELKEKHGKVIPLSAAMFILYGDEIVYLFSGSYDEYKKFFGQYRIQWEMISYACNHNYRRYNFYGIKDINTEDKEEQGVLKFKQNFNGYIEELLGAYMLPINKTIYTIERIKRKIRK